MNKQDLGFILNRHWAGFLILSIIIGYASGCTAFSTRNTVKVPLLLKTSDATREELFAQINRLAEIKSVNGNVLVKFEDNSFAESGIAEKFKSADGKVIVQSPGNINLRIQIPVIGTDIVQMTSDGEKFRVAVLCCVDAKYKQFVTGTNSADYSTLEKKARTTLNQNGEQSQAVSAFASLRPQHFTDALLMPPINSGSGFTYTQSTIYQEEAGEITRKSSASSRVVRGYYLLDELQNDNGTFTIKRRFWFDRINGVRLARQQLFDAKGEIEADVAYFAEKKFTAGGDVSMPEIVEVTRPQERYKVRLTYQSPAAVVVGKNYDPEIFVLENRWQLPEVDLDKQQTK